MENPPLGHMKRVDPRTAWATEDRDFTPWLAENLSVLAGALGLDLELEAREQPVGTFRADILCKEISSGIWVLIENQLKPTDHRHLGQLLTYAAGLEAAVMIWISTHFTEEHRNALDWLNRITDKNFQFFGLEIELWQIEGSPAAPWFNIVLTPSGWSRSTRKAADTGGSERKRGYEKYWAEFLKVLDALNRRIRGNRKPQSENWMGYEIRSIEGTRFRLHATVTSTRKQIGTGLLIEGKNPETFFDLLEKEKGTIESGSELGESLNWQKLPEKGRCRIDLPFTNSDPTNEADWPRQHRWLAEKLNALHGVFSPRIAKLDAADWRDDDRAAED